MLYYSVKDLREHQQLLTKVALGQTIDWRKMTTLEVRLVRQSLETILHPSEKEGVVQPLNALRRTLQGIFLTKDINTDLQRCYAVIATLELLSDIDPLQSIPWKTRRFVDDCLHVAALRALVNGPTTYQSLAEEQLLLSANGDIVSYTTTRKILTKMAKHKLAQRTVRGRFSVYHITDFGKKVLQLIGDCRQMNKFIQI